MNSSILPLTVQQNSLNPYFEISPQKEAKKLEKEALTWKLLTVISTIAFVSIMGAALAFSFGLVTIPIALFVPLVLSTVPLNWSIRKCFVKQIKISELAKIEKKVAAKLEDIQHWNKEQIQKFLSDQEISSKENNTLSTELLPGIARYQYYESLSTEIITLAKQDLSTHMQKTEIEDLCHFHAFYRLEFKGFPALVKAARMLEILRQPNSQMSLKEDRLRLKSFSQRMLHRYCSTSPNDDYVKLAGDSVTFGEIYEKPNPKVLRKRLYPAS